MSKFYPTFEEKRNAERHAMHIQQAKTITTGKHTGSKNQHKLICTIHRATRFITGLMSDYNA